MQPRMACRQLLAVILLTNEVAEPHLLWDQFPRMMVRIEADKQTVPRDEPVERTTAAWMMCVDIGDGDMTS